MAFIQCSGTNFALDGQIWRPFGSTIYDDLYFPARFPAKFDACLAMGHNIVRFVNFMNTSGDPGTEFLIYDDIDQYLEYCRTRGLKVLLDLSDFGTVSLARDHEFGDAGFLAEWESFVTTLFNRVNTINGRVYKDDDTIAIISIIGEAENHYSGEGLLARTMYNTIAGYIKAVDTNHIVHAGGMPPSVIVDEATRVAMEGNGPAQDILTAPNIDCASTHPYYAQSTMLLAFPFLKQYSEACNKPWFIEEFGYTQSPKIRSESDRAKSFRFVVKEGFRNGSAGHLFWNFDSGIGGGYGVNPNTEEVYRTVQSLSRMKGYSPRLPVF